MAEVKSRTQEVLVPVYLPEEEFRWGLQVLGLGVSAEQMELWESARWDAVYQLLFDVFLTKRLAQVLGIGADAVSRGKSESAQGEVRESLKEAARDLPQRQGLVFHFFLRLRKAGQQLADISIVQVKANTY